MLCEFADGGDQGGGGHFGAGEVADVEGDGGDAEVVGEEEGFFGVVEGAVDGGGVRERPARSGDAKGVDGEMLGGKDGFEMASGGLV